MKNEISAQGYTKVIMVVDMKHLIVQGDQNRFENIRGTKEFANAIRNNWQVLLHSQNHFISNSDNEPIMGISVEDICFATGIFNSVMLNEYTTPTYTLNKENVKFPKELILNFQFKNLFLRAWNKWEISIRPTVTGFFVIRLINRFTKHRPLINIAKDFIELQESFDVIGALEWAKRTQETYPEISVSRRKSIDFFLDWLGFDQTNSSNIPKIFPIQWKIATESLNLLMSQIGEKLIIKGQNPIQFQKLRPSQDILNNNLYTIHHLDNLIANPKLVKRFSSKPDNITSKSQVNLNDIRNSPKIREVLTNLIEGVILKNTVKRKDLFEYSASFPKLRWPVVDNVLEKNQATLNDELCLITPKTSIIIPSPKWKYHELLISSIPSSSALRVQYIRQWHALERMIEFVIEVNALANTSERRAYNLLEIISSSFNEKNKTHLLDAQLTALPNAHLSVLLSTSADLRRIAGLCQGLSNPRLWCNFEFAILLSKLIFEKLETKTRLDHIERNISNLADYIEIYRSEMVESENRKADLRSVGLAAASLMLVLFMLPSFYTDTWQLAQNLNNQYNGLLNIFATASSTLGLIVLFFSIYTIFSILRQQIYKK